MATFDPARSELAYASAGHPPALLLHGGEVCWLDQGRSVPIGLRLGPPRPTAVIPVTGPASILLFTDGAVERRGESLDTGFERLARAGRAGPADQPVDELLARVRDPAGRDDSVLLRVDLLPVTAPTTTATAARAGGGAVSGAAGSDVDGP